ncbi:unnamed protein product [Adineta ricciae]|uniref:Fringe-like glycosyltransferase domain-containing protein n=1 Tax=Adineta ricciae TaxID=249248 RepID=A0A813ZY27_ADIRI|nr:unnamed protein product [Adineta ricciae]
MHRIFRPSPLHIRYGISLLLSLSVSLLLISLTTHYPSHSIGSIGKSNEIADRILLTIRTSNSCQSRLTYLLQSWLSPDFSEQRNIYLTTDRFHNQSKSTIWNAFRHVIQTDCPMTHNLYDLCCKSAHEFDLFYELHSTTRSDLQWMCRFDDDQYVNLNNLYQYISKFDSSRPYYIGRTSVSKRLRIRNDNRTYSFATYGAGVCYSQALLQLLRPHVSPKIFAKNCVSRSLPDDAYMGYLSEIVLNVSLTAINDRLHSHLQTLDNSWRTYSLADLTRMITLGFAWDRYKLDWLPIIHRLIQLVDQNQYEAADRLWLFLRDYEKAHPENLTGQYDQSCTSYKPKPNTTKSTKVKTPKIKS